MTQMTPNAAQPNAYDLQSCMLQSRRMAKLPEAALLSEFAQTLATDRGTTVELLIQVGTIEARGLYRSRACDSMYTWCTEVLHMSEGTAYKRIRAARVARRFPALLPMVADGRLHLSAVVLLAPHLKRENADELFASATLLSKAAVERLVAERFPRPDVPTQVRALGAPAAQPAASAAAQIVANIAAQLSPGTVAPTKSVQFAAVTEPLLTHDPLRAVQQVMVQALGDAVVKCGAESMSQPVLAALADSVAEVIVNAAAGVRPHALELSELPAKTTPLATGRFAWQLTADQSMQELLEEARQLLGHEVPGGDLKTVLKRGLEVLVQQLRRSKRAETSNPRPKRASANGRYVPRAVVRAVHERDGGQCTFEGPDGRRCTARSNLQLDHVIPFARGGRTNLENLRQLCAAHNQYEAERAFGREHMDEQRRASRVRAEQAAARRAEASVVRRHGQATPT